MPWVPLKAAAGHPWPRVRGEHFCI